ncbi:hypothetical protein EMIT0373P_30817 [Pseudomonas chlororaphis]
MNAPKLLFSTRSIHTKLDAD